MKHTPIRAVSKKRRSENRERKKLTDAMKREGPVMCQFVWWGPTPSPWGTQQGQGCGCRADDLHEPGKRSQGADPSDAEQTIPLCRQHHDWTHEHPREAAQMGLLHSRKHPVEAEKEGLSK